MSCIDFDGYKDEIREGLYCHINDTKSTSGCTCICVACLLNNFLSDEGYDLNLDSTMFLKVVSAFTNIKEDSLRKLFCNPESEESIDAFEEYLIKYLLETELIVIKTPREDAAHFKTEDLKKIFDNFPGRLKRSDNQKNLFMLGTGYEKKKVGHCINFLIKCNRLVVLDAQNGGYCKPKHFEGVNDVRVYSLSKRFKRHVLRDLPKPKPTEKSISFSDFLRICKEWGETVQYDESAVSLEVRS